VIGHQAGDLGRRMAISPPDDHMIPMDRMMTMKTGETVSFPLRRLTRLLPVLVWAASAHPLTGQQAPADTVPAYLLEGVTVTATRQAAERARLPQRVDVVTSTDLDRSGARTLGEALRSTVAVDVVEYPGLLAGVSIRGYRPQYSGTNRTLILMDGRPAGTNNVALLGASGVDRIEVLRGPASALYGSSAMGGVINVVTRRTVGGLGGRGDLAYGSFGGYEGRLSAGGALSTRTDFDLSASFVGHRSGYRTGDRRTFAVDSLLKTLPDGTSTRLPRVTADTVVDFARYATRGGSARVGHRLGGGWRVDVAAEGLEGSGIQNPGDLTPTPWDGRSVKDLVRGSAELAISGSHGSSQPSLRLFSARETVDYYSAPEAPNFISFRTPQRTSGAQLQNVAGFRGHSATAGVDLASTLATSHAFTAEGVPGAPYSPDSEIRSAAAFAQAVLSLLDDRLVLSGGTRADRVALVIRETPELVGHRWNEETHAVVTPRGGIRLGTPGRLQLYANAGRAFVTPEAFHVAGYSELRAGSGRNAVFVTRGNPALRPETGRTWDIGLALLRPARGLEVDVSYFDTDVRDRISAVSDPDPGPLTPAGDSILSAMTYANVDRAVIRGVEVKASQELRGSPGAGRSLRPFLSLNWVVRAEEIDEASGVEQRIRNVAAMTAVAGVDLTGRRFTGRWSGRYVGDRVDDDYVAWWAPGEIEYPAYLVFDLSGSLHLGERYRATIEVRNLTNEDYFEIRGYNLPGRSARLKLSARF
jgi:vitamin B12 transporter